MHRLTDRLPSLPAMLVCAASSCLAFVPAACTAPPGGTPPEVARQEFLDADRAFLRATRARSAAGWASAFLEDGAMMLPGFRVSGRDSVRAAMETAFSDTAYRIEWEPEDAEVLGGGGAGLTTGRYRTGGTAPDGTVRRTAGRYVTLWERDGDGNWKVRLDVGLPDPEVPR